MKPSSGPLTWLLPMVLGFLAFATVQWAQQRVLLDRQINDWVIRLRGPLAPHPDLALITFDRGSQKRMGLWPGEEELQAELLDRLGQAGARCVIYHDPPFAPRQHPGRLVAWAQAHPECPVFFAPRYALDPFAEEAIEIVQELAPELRRAFQPGVAYLEPDADGVVRRFPLTLTFKDRTFVNFPWAVSQRLGAAPLAESVEAEGEVRMPFIGPARSFPSFSCWRILEGDLPAGALRGKICVVGNTDSVTAAPRSTPTGVSPLFMPPVEIHANALDALLTARYYRPVPVAALLGAAALLAVLLTLVFTVLRPAPALLALGLYLSTLAPLAAWLAREGPYEVPLLPLAVLGLVACLASLGMELVQVQDDLLNLLTASHRTSWLFKEAAASDPAAGETLEAMLRLAKETASAEGLALAVPFKDLQAADRASRLKVSHSLGWEGDPPAELAQESVLLEPEARRLATLKGPRLQADPGGEYWAFKVVPDAPSSAWLILRPAPGAVLQSVEPVLEAILGQLAPLIGLVREGRGARLWERFWDLPLLRVFSSTYGRRVLSKLSSLEDRNHAEREVLSRMLDDLEVGLVLADGLGRARLVNRLVKSVVKASGTYWDGVHVWDLLCKLTEREMAVLAKPLGNAICKELPATFPVNLKAGLRQSFLVAVLPLHSGRGPRSGGGEAARWPDHFVLILTDVTSMKQIDLMKTELLEAISFKARNHLAALMGYCDLLVDAPEMATELVQDMRKEAEEMNEIFKNFASAAAFSVDYKEQKQQVPINMNRMAEDVIQNVSELAKTMQVEVRQETEQLVNLVLADEQSLRTALISLLYTCLSSSRDKAVVSLQVTELDKNLLVTIQGQNCVLSPKMLRRLMVKIDAEGEEEAESDMRFGGARRVPQMVEREGVKWLKTARQLIEKNRGKIEVEALGGMGVRFRVTLPKIA